MSSKPLENKESPALKARLQALGFEQTQFEPKVSNRFIVKIDGFPSYIIKGIRLPDYEGKGGFQGATVSLECYNPLDTKLEEAVMALVDEEAVQIIVQLLTPTADIDTEWFITGKKGRACFGSLNWSSDGEPNKIYIHFEVQDATIGYPSEYPTKD